MHFKQNVKAAPTHSSGFKQLFNHGNVLPWLPIGAKDVAIVCGEEIFLAHVTSLTVSWGHSGALTTAAFRLAPPYDQQVIVVGFQTAAEFWAFLTDATNLLLNAFKEDSDELFVFTLTLGKLLEDIKGFSNFSRGSRVEGSIEFLIKTSLMPFRSAFDELAFDYRLLAKQYRQAQAAGKDSVLVHADNASVVEDSTPPQETEASTPVITHPATEALVAEEAGTPPGISPDVILSEQKGAES